MKDMIMTDEQVPSSPNPNKRVIRKATPRKSQLNTPPKVATRSSVAKPSGRHAPTVAQPSTNTNRNISTAQVKDTSLSTSPDTQNITLAPTPPLNNEAKTAPKTSTEQQQSPHRSIRSNRDRNHTMRSASPTIEHLLPTTTKLKETPSPSVHPMQTPIQEQVNSPIKDIPILKGMHTDPQSITTTPEIRQADRKAFLEPVPIQPPRGAEGLTLLGNQHTVYSDSYTPTILETFINKHQENNYWVKFNCPEFTSLCPMTGQPDFATLYISYIPDVKMVESKSLKLYLFSFRNHGAFHEDCVNIIMKDLIKLMSPRYIEVWGKFLPRGGLSIDPYCNYGRPSTPFEEIADKRMIMHDLNLERVDNR